MAEPSDAPQPVERKKELKITEPHYNYVVFNDPIHGTIRLHPLLNEVINTPEFNRLKNIKQLGGLHYVYPGATHTRFEHSIGVCYIAGEFVRMLKENQPDELEITDKEVLCVEMAGLCHDLGHGPFSHMFERIKWIPEEATKDETTKDEATKDDKPNELKHEDLSKKIFEKIYLRLKASFVEYGFTPEDVTFIQEMIEHDDITKVSRFAERRFLYEIVANQVTKIDVDKWDYFARDCHYIGVSNSFDWRRCMSLCRVIKEKRGETLSVETLRLSFRDKELTNIYDMFRTRSYLHMHAYQHKTVIAVEYMLKEAIRLAGESGAKLLRVKDANGTSDRFISIKEAVSEARNGDLNGYLALTDSIVQLIIHADPSKLCDTSQKDKLEKAQTLLRKIDERVIFHLVHYESWDDIPQKFKDKFDQGKATEDLCKATKEDVFVQKVKISYGTKNPEEKVCFYTKDKPDDFMTPPVPKLIKRELFEDTELRVYWLKGEGTEEAEKAQKEAIKREFKKLFDL